VGCNTYLSLEINYSGTLNCELTLLVIVNMKENSMPYLATSDWHRRGGSMQGLMLEGLRIGGSIDKVVAWVVDKNFLVSLCFFPCFSVLSKF
jgi:hypothetical protein